MPSTSPAIRPLGSTASSAAAGNHTHLLAAGATDVTPTVANLNKMVRGYGPGLALYAKSITLAGANPTQVVFAGGDQAATLLASNAQPYALDNGMTLIINADGAGDSTFTFAAAAGTSVSAGSPSTDLTATTDPTFRIAVDGGAVQSVTLAQASCGSGANTAAEMQTKIRAKGGACASVTVAYTTVYTITSATKGTASAIVVTAGAANDCSAALKIGVANGGTEQAGTGNAANIAAATAAEVAAAIASTPSGWTAVAEGTKVRVNSDTTGGASSLVVNASSTADTVLGITGTDKGAEGLSAGAMADTDYWVSLTMSGASGAPADTLAVGDKTAAGFNVYSETAGSTNTVDVLVVGTPA